MESKPLEFLVLGLCASSFCFGLMMMLARHLKRKISRNPRVILRRSKRKLKLIRRDLDQIPATHEIHYLYDEIENTERTIKRTESWFHHAARK
jgi:hypothetical protein